MEDRLELARQRDIVWFTLVGEHALTGKTVRMQTAVEALVRDRNEEEVRKDILSGLKKLVNTEWNLSHINRASIAGDERINLVATARVEEKEDRDLENRAREACKTGLTISKPHVDRSFPLSEIEKGRSELRASLTKRANEEREKLNKHLGRNYALGEITFRQEAKLTASNKTSTYSLSSMSDAEVEAAAGGGYDMGTSEKIIMFADVMLVFPAAS